MSGKINFLCAPLEEKTWTQNHVLQNLTLVAYSIASMRDLFSKKLCLSTSIIPQYLCKVLVKSAVKHSRYKVSKNSTLLIQSVLLPHERSRQCFIRRAVISWQLTVSTGMSHVITLDWNGAFQKSQGVDQRPFFLSLVLPAPLFFSYELEPDFARLLFLNFQEQSRLVNCLSPPELLSL